MSFEQFSVNKTKKIFIYGAAAGGTILYQRMKANGYQVIGFIDKRAEEIRNLCGLPVYTAEQLCMKYASRQFIVIIAVKNVFEHSRIARALIEHGIQNIIYKPYTVLKGYADVRQQRLYDLHEQFICNGSCEEQNVFKAYNMEQQNAPKEYLIKKEAESQVVFLPLPLLFENKDIHKKNQERNVCFLYPHIQFFRFLQGEAEASPYYYVEYCETAAKKLGTFSITDAWRENVIRNRAEVFDQMNHAFLFQKDFFAQNAPNVIWNANGYFNLTSGKHRAAFFAARRLMYIPVRMTFEDAEKWFCEAKAKEVEKLLWEWGIYELKAPIEHPYFYQMPCTSENFFYGLLCALAERIGGIYYKSPVDNIIYRKKIYIHLDDSGFLSRFFRRSGAFVYSNEQTDQKMEDMLDCLFGISTDLCISMEEKYDIAIIKIDHIDTLKQWERKKMADICFVIGEEAIIGGLAHIKYFYCGVVWNKKITVGYLEENYV